MRPQGFHGPLTLPGTMSAEVTRLQLLVEDMGSARHRAQSASTLMEMLEAWQEVEQLSAQALEVTAGLRELAGSL